MTEEKTEKEESPSGAIKQVIDSATALSKAVPIYEDAVQPFAQETGRALGTVGKAVNVALAPISLVVWGYDQIKEFLETKVTEKLENVPEDRISTPPPHVAGPAVEALKFTGQEETLRDMFANLIANSLDSKTVKDAHPSFVDIIKNLSPDEGLILKLFAAEQNLPLIDVRIVDLKKGNSYSVILRNHSEIGIIAKVTHPQLTTNYLDNLCRLGILEIPSGSKLSNLQRYKALKELPEVALLSKQFESIDTHRIEFSEKYVQVTGMGRQFINSCVVDKRTKA